MSRSCSTSLVARVLHAFWLKGGGGGGGGHFEVKDGHPIFYKLHDFT